MRISTGQMYQQSVSNILTKQTELARLQAQIATGKRILSPSDDPAASAQVLDIENATSQTDQYQRNADMITSRLQLEETTIASASDVLTRARELALQGRSGQYSDEERSYLAVEVRQLLAQMMSLANTRDGNGEYLFAGFQGKTQPFALNSTTGDVDYNGDQGSRVVNVSPTNTVADADPGSDVFMMIRNGNGSFATSVNGANTGTGVIDVGSVTDASAFTGNDYRIVFTSATTYDILDDTSGSVVASAQSYASGSSIAFDGINVVIKGAPAAGDEFNISPSANQSVFETLQTLAEALETPIVGADHNARFQSLVSRTIADLDQSQQRMLEVRASIGARENIIESQKSFNDDLSLQLTGLRSTLEDADIVETASKLSLQLTTLQAAQAAFARMQNLSLFNYL
jgi:flagellar hook-associated protein 3 FlgL